MAALPARPCRKTRGSAEPPRGRQAACFQSSPQTGQNHKNSPKPEQKEPAPSLPLIGGLCLANAQSLARVIAMATGDAARPRRSMAAYRPGVLIGNWSEEARLEEDRLRDFMQKRERGELLIQKLNKLQDNLFKKIQLSVSKDGFVHFGDTVMLLNPDNKSSVENDPGACGSLALAINLDEMSMFSAKSLQAPCGVSAVESVDPVGRNTFCILSVDGGATDEPIRFGQKFGLGTTGGFSDQMLYLASDHKSFIRFAKKSYLQQVFLTDELSYLTCWQATFLDPQLRLEYEGFPVPANSKMIITHCHTNRSLAVPRNFWTRSYFGKEYEVICHTYLDSHKAEEDKNYWIIVTGNPSYENGTMIDRPKPHPGGIRKDCEET